MRIRIRETEAVVYDDEFRRMYPDTSFPAVLAAELLDEFGADPVLNAPQPEHGEFETVALDGAVQDSLGNWMENWVVRPMFVEYTDPEGVTHTVAEQQSAYTQSKIDQWRQSASCTPFQGRMALADAGLLTQVETAIAAADEKTKVAWEYALEWKRTSPMIAALSIALNMQDTTVDDLFKAAAQIEA